MSTPFSFTGNAGSTLSHVVVPAGGRDRIRVQYASATSDKAGSLLALKTPAKSTTVTATSAANQTVVIPSDHAEKLVGFAVHPSAVAVAMRYLQPVAEYQQSGAVTDPQTGMTFGYLRFTDTRANKVFVTVECLYGFATAKADAIKRLVKP